MPMDPDAKRLVDLIALTGRPPLSALPPETARAQYRNQRGVMQTPPEPVAECRDLEVDAPVRLRLYRGMAAASGRCLLYCHGGGWVVGDLDSHDGICRRLANLAACRVIAVDYRLAPEYRFPAAVDDTAAAMRWVVAHAGELDIDPAQIAVAGDSAGANLVTVLALMGRDGSVPAPCFQMLFYPATDLECTMPSFDRFTEGVTLTAETMRWFRDQYLGEAGRRDWRASPLYADLTGVAPAFVLTAGYDPLCDEGIAYAQRLDAAGVQTAHLHMPTQVHGFLTMSRFIRAADTVIDTAGAMLRQTWRAPSP
jgi:acetyl esterase